MSNNRINYVDIAGTKYPLTFSLSAAKAISSQYGSLENMFKEIQNTEDSIKQLDTVLFVLLTLIKQGCAYLNTFEKNVPHDTEGTCFDGEKYIAITQENLELGINIFDMNGIVQAITESISSSSNTTVKVESNGEEKNEISPAEVTETSGLICGEED